MTSGDAHPFLATGGVIEVEGNPTDGWTLVNFDGQPIPEYPGLLTQLIIDARNVIAAPQIAAYNLFEATLTGGPTTIEQTLLTGLQNVGAAVVQFPGSVVSDVADAVQTLTADMAAGETFSDAFGSVIVRLVP